MTEKGGEKMKRNCSVMRKVSKGRLVVFALVVFSLLCFGRPSTVGAIDTGVENLSMLGYIMQSATYALHDNRADNKDGFNSFVTQAILETRYDPIANLAMFLSIKANVDWAYPIYSGTNEWREKEFNKARDRLFVLYKPRDVIGEAHITFKPNDQWYFRVGKQIVQWGQTDGFLLMNQINPLDQRRGITDVEFENTLIPTWLIRAEYIVPQGCLPNWLSSINLQGLFIPNADFAANADISGGNTFSGIWAPYVEINPVPGVPIPYPMDYFHVGEFRRDISKPDQWDPQGHAFGFRISTVTSYGAGVTLNGYYGRSHDVAVSGPIGADFTPFDWDGRQTIHPWFEAYYPFVKFLGATYTDEISFLKAAWLGNVAPVLRFEGLYAFDSKFSTSNDAGSMAYYMAKQGDNFWESDEVRLMVGADWKVRIRPLNSKTFFFISPQLYWRHIVDYPGSDALGKKQHIGDPNGDTIYRDTWTTTLMVNTNYFHTKLQPSFFWLRDWSTKSGFYKPQLAYEYSNVWKYSLGAIIVDGEKLGQGMQPMNYKDHVYFTVSYRF